MKEKKSLPKIECEICSEDDKSTLQYHHIIERTELECTDHNYNLAVICSNCHNKIHHGNIEIIGIYPSTKRPYGRSIIYKFEGKANLPNVNEPYYKPKPKAQKVFYEEESGEFKNSDIAGKGDKEKISS